jgi:hypothetical protein
MKTVTLSFFYRDGANYKDHFDKDIPFEIFFDFIKDNEFEWDIIDYNFNSDLLFEIENFGLSPSDIPQIQEYGFDDEYDHNYVSITKIKDIDQVKLAVNLYKSKENKEAFLKVLQEE